KNDTKYRTFEEPSAISLDQRGNVYISDKTDKSIVKFDCEGNFILKIGQPASNIFAGPMGLASDSVSNLYIIDTNITTNESSLIITTNSFVFIQEIEINDFIPNDVCVDEKDNILVLTNESILKYRFLNKFQQSHSQIQSNLTADFRNCWENFENDDIGGHPDTNWITDEDPGAQIEIIESYLDYSKVVQFNDTVDGDLGSISANLTSPPSNLTTIYVTWAVNGTSDSLCMGAADFGVESGFIGFAGFDKSGNFSYCNDLGQIVPTDIPYKTKHFYTFKMITDMTNRNYTVYYWNESKWNDLVVNTPIFGYPPTTETDFLIIYTPGGTGYTGMGYVAAVDYSWNEGYYEDRILSNTPLFKTPVFDKEGNLYIMGNNTIHKYDNYGTYLETFDSGLNGTGTEIRIKDFENASYLYHALHDDDGPEHVVKYTLSGEKIGQINITDYDNLSSIAIDDEESIYCLTDSGIVKYFLYSGNFTANFSFNSDPVGSNPDKWFVYEDPDCVVDVIEEIGNHSKVVKIEDNNTSGWASMQYSSIYQYYPNQDNGVIEFYIRTNDTTKYTQIYIRPRYSKGTFFYINDNNFYRQGSGSIITSASNDTWYHIKFKYNQNHWHLYIDDVRYPTTGEWTLQTYLLYPNITCLMFCTANKFSGYVSYVDAVDFSWADGYYEGRNKIANNYYYKSSCNYNESGEISSEGLKNQIEIDSLGNIYYLSHSTNEILKIDWEAKEISERWPIDQNLTEHQLVIDGKDNLYLLNKYNEQGQIIQMNKESLVESRYEFNYDNSNEISIGVDFDRNFYIFKATSNEILCINKFGDMEPIPDFIYQITDVDTWKDIAINSTGYIFAISAQDNKIKVYNSTHFYVETLDCSGLDSPSKVQINRNDSFIVLDSNQNIKLFHCAHFI
ncbi:MAG: hypothetical protein ACFFDN_48490, partial [Candidatus Hodarchaeota archaeon]